MTPLLNKIAALATISSKKKLMWFDYSSGYVGEITPDYFVFVNPLPFEAVSIVVEQEAGSFCVIITDIEVPDNVKDRYPTAKKATGFAGLAVLKPSTEVTELPKFYIVVDEEKQYLHMFLADGTKREDASEKKKVLMTSMLSVASHFLKTLEEIGCTGAIPTPNKSNLKRIRQGKKPLFEWTTVTIEPRSAKNESLGGTHASPRQHDVRGHWVVRNGNKFWRRPHKRGDASKGVIFHDYVVKPAVERRAEQ